MPPTLETLPAELVLRILAYLPVQSLRALRLASRSWDTFFVEHESTIYHHAALIHRFIDSVHQLLPEAKAAHPLKFLQDVPDWYHYCRQYFQLQRNWTGKGAATARYYDGHPNDIHRIKIDEDYSLLIVTHEFGGLTVFDLETAEVLWHLDSTYIRRYAHCEYEKGYLLFDRNHIVTEAWRLEVEYDPSSVPPESIPDEAQIEAWRKASRQYSHTGPRGHFRPWCLIETSEFTRAYRFVYPNFLVSGLRKAYLWDVPTGRLILEVENVQGNSAGGDINYVELSVFHIFVCSTSALRVFSKTNGQLVLEINSYQLVYSDIRLAVQLDPAIARHKYAGPSEAVALPAEPTATTALYTASYAEFSAVHVSRDGKDLVAQLSDSRLVVIRDFMRVVRGEIALSAAALEIGKTIPRHGGTDEHFSIYLSYEHGRLGVVTTSGIYAATLDPTYHGLLDADLVDTGKQEVFRIPMEAVQKGISFPYITFVSLPFYHDRRQLSKVTCIQITETKLYFVWDAMYKPDSIDFFRQLGMIGDNTPPPPGDDDPDEGLFTTEAAITPAQAATAEASVDSEGDEDWDTQDVVESQALVASGSGIHTATADDTPVAGPSTAGVAVDATDDDDNDDNFDDNFDDGGEENDHDHWDDDDSESDGDDLPGPQNPLVTLRHSQNVVSTGPIVFCIDFSPQ
ncbi:hypothetical protein L226DRAFT_548676 [Lentinus tigrinus ALCF2SS1-7]|uniref:F-box domain-containing protein n=1 Tax=Lentinus tigrinus ALCF2SS1-6 TaxID=1328759 RepID=A0A5C2RRG2_9APHY|nr:hypothetical protein L227DRAFT_581944 [Lentinus tigrinus ALCF2SS1-6]RPD68082.1 hypothetical protein L226DRAFT_548676 [Lentinus tigrinus ALCF2SS1-7]